VRVNDKKTKCVFVSCAQNAVREYSKQTGDKSVDSGTVQILGNKPDSKYCMNAASTSCLI
jgi:hypothetical protein